MATKNQDECNQDAWHSMATKMHGIAWQPRYVAWHGNQDVWHGMATLSHFSFVADAPALGG